MRAPRLEVPAPLATSTWTCAGERGGLVVVVESMAGVEVGEEGACVVGGLVTPELTVTGRGAACRSTTPMITATASRPAPFSVWVLADRPNEPSSRACVPRIIAN